MNPDFNSAKTILDFYMEKLEEDVANANAHFALQYANLKMLKLRTNAILDSLESYELEVE